MFVFIARIFYTAASLLVKAALLALYLRIFNPVPSVNYIIIGCITTLAIFYSTTIIIDFAVTIPRKGSTWIIASTSHPKVAVNIGLAQAVFGAISDWVILMIPLALVVPLRMATKQKVAVTGIFLTGLLYVTSNELFISNRQSNLTYLFRACICSILICVFRFRIRNTADFLWDYPPVIGVGVVELTVGNICCTLPTFPALWHSFTRTSQVQSVVRYFKSAKSRVAHASDSSSHNLDRHKQNGLPSIPRGRLTGLRSFVQIFSMTDARTTAKGEGGGTVDSTTGKDNNLSYVELRSVDVDYHAHLKGQEKSGMRNLPNGVEQTREG